MPVYVNRAHVATTTTGTGTITLGTAVPGFQTFGAAGLVDGQTVSYTIEDTGNAWEVGTGVYSSTGPTLTRTLVQSSSGALLNLTGQARVYVIQSADNMTNLKVGDGTAALPSVAFDSDPDTGFSSGGANTLVASTAGSERLRIDSSGNLGVGGTAAATAILDLVSTTKGFRAPSMTTTQRDVIVSPATGLMIYNTTLNSYQVYNGTAWASVGGGATGGGSNAVFFENDQTVTANYTITAGKNAMSAGPITIGAGVTVTIPAGSNWTVV